MIQKYFYSFKTPINDYLDTFHLMEMSLKPHAFFSGSWWGASSWEEKHLPRNFFFFFEPKGYYISVEGHGLFIGMEAKCFFSDCFMELSQCLDC